MASAERNGAYSSSFVGRIVFLVWLLCALHVFVVGTVCVKKVELNGFE
jgi:hypothetical protein